MVTGVEALTVAAVIVKVAAAEPCGTVIEDGMVSAAEGDEERATVAPPEGAAVVSCTVPVPD